MLEKLPEKLLTITKTDQMDEGVYSRANELLGIFNLPKDQQEAQSETFYNSITGLDQRLTFGTAHVSDTGKQALLDIEQLLIATKHPDLVTEGEVTEKLKQFIDMFREKINNDGRLRGLSGINTHDTYALS